MPAIRVNRDRLWNSLMEMGEIGSLPHGGCRRLALSDDDGLGRDLFVRWCREAGCEIGVDQVGNVFARRPGRAVDVPAIATGSHLDTQPHGGKFDGIYGVLAGLEVVRTLNDHGIETDRPIDIVVWTNEEASRFYPPLTGSSTFAGLIDPSDVHRMATFDGTLVGEDLLRIGYLGDEKPGSRALDSFVELHIEQGPILEAESKVIGVVTRIQGLRFLTVVLNGEDGHAGTLPMTRRRDALVGAARMILFLEELARTTDNAARLTVGSLEVSPNSTSTVPGEVKFTIDLRHPDEATLVTLTDIIQSKLPEIAGASGLEVAISVGLEKKPVVFDEAIGAQIQAAAEELGFTSLPILSGAGHDAMNLAPLMPTGMIFIPCAEGISHNEREYADPAHIAAGADVLLQVLLQRANH